MSCSQNLATIAKACNRGTGRGLLGKIYVAAEEDVATIPAAVSHVISTAITMEAAALFYEWAIDKEGSSFTSEVQGEGESKYYLNTLTVFIPGLTETISHSLTAMVRGAFVVVFTDKNGKRRLLGTIDDGAIASVSEATNDRNGYTVVFTWESTDVPYYYTSTLTTS